jgi:inorganic pyrophosphatase
MVNTNFSSSNFISPFISLSPFDSKSKSFNVIIDTPKGSRNKFKFDEEFGLFKLGGVLPVGSVFPYDFGYIPSTLGGDGDPLDVLIMMDEPAFVGCLVSSRLIGVIEAEQKEGNEVSRNDRLIAVATDSRNHTDVHSLKDLNENLIHEIEHFFISYNQSKNKLFKPLSRSGPSRAQELVEEAIQRFKDK